MSDDRRCGFCKSPITEENSSGVIGVVDRNGDPRNVQICTDCRADDCSVRNLDYPK